jgi:type IV pilus assembly protein PilY1
VALVMSIDQELSKKAYSDYSNLDGGVLVAADTTYRDNFNYYGYFDPDWCYTYDTTPAASAQYFTPYAKVLTTSPLGHQCTSTSVLRTLGAVGAWSGNFLNWATMTRMDILRRVLFGGKRDVDTSSQTILQRAYLPNDIHSFVKIYSNADIYKFTPYTSTKSFCNTSTETDANSGYPVFRIADGSFPAWSAKEGVQCSIGGTSAPGVLDATATVRTEVCVTGKDGGSAGSDTSGRCRKYGTSALKKPMGLLQKYGEDKTIKFSLTTGSYVGHLKGGVLRKKAGLIAGNTNAAYDEIDLTNGIFNFLKASPVATSKGIISNISNFKIANWQFSVPNSYAQYGDCNPYSILVNTVKDGTTTNKTCTDWGNPLAETYMEMLRYVSGAGALGGTGPTSDFNVDDSTASGNFPGITALSKEAAWDDPWTEWCATCSSIVISTGSNSFDGDNLSSPTPIPGLSTAADVFAKTNTVGVLEGLAGNYFAGSTTNRYCESTAFANLSGITGICPELPGLEGTYNIAGLAYHAHITDLRPSLHGPVPAATPQNPNPVATDKQTVNTYAVDLAESMPTLTFEVGANRNKVSLVPFCQSNDGNGWSGCTLIDVTVNSLASDGKSGSYTFYWEDSLWGNDNDLDVSQQIDFCIGTACGAAYPSDQIKLTTILPSFAAGNQLRLSYSIYGVSHAAGSFNLPPSNRGLYTFDVNFPGGLFSPNSYYVDCVSNCFFPSGAGNFVNGGNSTVDFTSASASASTIKVLNKPLFLAAKYGGFIDNGNATTPIADVPDHASEWDKDGNGVPDSFFSVKNPSLLEDSLELVIQNILSRNGSASAVATTSTRLAADSFVYQGMFESKVWTGELRAFRTQASGLLNMTPAYTSMDIGRMPRSEAGRSLWTYKSDGSMTRAGKQTVALTWANLDPTQQAKLALPGDSSGTDQKRLAWIQGSNVDENNAVDLRRRDVISNGTSTRNILGDIVNSSPAYLGAYDFNYDQLAAGGSSYRSFYTTKRAQEPLVFVGANDGMVHAFIGNSATASRILTEKFAYVPNFAFDKLAKITRSDYGSSSNPHQYIVDGSIAVADVYTQFSWDSAPTWHSIVVGSMGAGAKGIYALDVTVRNAPKVIFEYSNPGMGYVLGKLYVVPTTNGRWVVLFSNGPGGGTSKLFAVDIQDPFNESGTNTVIMDTGEGTGLSSPTVLLNAVGQLSSVYAGDLSGNLRHFLLANTNYTLWSSYKMFKAQSASGVDQAITAAPAIGYNKYSKTYMAYFGTGRYFNVNDNLTDPIRESFYAVTDRGAGTLSTRADLINKSMTTTYSPASRTVDTLQPNWNSQNGWRIDLDVNERVTTKAALIQNRVFITTLIPTTASCSAGGSSWFMEVSAIDAVAPVTTPTFDEVGVYISDGGVSLLSSSPTPSSSGSGSSTSSSSSSEGACPPLPMSFIRSGVNLDSAASGLNEQQITGSGCGLGRQSWRQLR